LECALRWIAKKHISSCNNKQERLAPTTMQATTTVSKRANANKWKSRQNRKTAKTKEREDIVKKTQLSKQQQLIGTVTTADVQNKAVSTTNKQLQVSQLFSSIKSKAS